MAEKPGRPAPLTCGGCGDVYDDWVWDDEYGEWEADVEWWHHPPSAHEFLCSRRCWLQVHHATCGRASPCKESQ